MGTRTPTPEAREPKSRMSTNSIMPAYRLVPANHTIAPPLCQLQVPQTTKVVAVRGFMCYTIENHLESVYSMELSLKGIQTKIFQLRHERVFRGSETRLKYMYFPMDSKLPNAANILLVGFQGCHDKEARYNYVRTCESLNVHRLFIKDDFAPNGRGSYYVGEKGTYSVERLVHTMVRNFMDRLQPDRVIFMGSSKGGYGAINCGIEFPNAIIVAGAPQYRLGTYLDKPANRPNLIDIIGEYTPENIAALDVRLEQKIKSNPHAATQTCYLHYSNVEHTYEKHIRAMRQDILESGITLHEDIESYPEHSDVGKYFPAYLVKIVNSYMDK